LSTIESFLAILTKI